MATSKDFLNFVLEQLSELDEITYRMMMGEYIIYYKGKIAAELCDNRFLVKPVDAAAKYIKNAVYEPPYKGAKPMILVENIDSREYLTGLFEAIYPELPVPKPKKNKREQEVTK